MTSLHQPAHGRMRVVAFASGSGTNFREAVLESREAESNFSIDLLVTDKEVTKDGKRIGAIDYAEQFGIPAITLNGYRACGSWKQARESVQGVEAYRERCEVFNSSLYEKIRAFEQTKGIQFDFAILAGYMRLFQGALLRRFQNRAVNVHPADLSIRAANGARRYIGENAVYDALLTGATRTRSSIILVDAATDAGALLVSGPWVSYTGGRPPAQGDADEHQEKQKAASDWPALRFALREIAHGNFALHEKRFHGDGNPFVTYKGGELGYAGFVLD